MKRALKMKIEEREHSKEGQNETKEDEIIPNT